MEDREIQDTLAETELADALTELVEMANQRGGHDNITILGLRVPMQDQSAEATVQLEKKPRPILIPWMTCAIIVLLALAILLLGAASIWFFNRAESLPTPTATLNSTLPTVTLPLSPTDVLQTNTPIPSETPIQPTLTAWPTNSPESQDTGGS